MPIEATQKPYKAPSLPAEGKGSPWTHIGLRKTTKKKIALLAKVRDGNIYEMVGEWADEAWAQAKAEGLVTDAMMVEPTATKGGAQ